MKKCLCLLALVLAASAFGYPSCGTGQISAGSLVDCSVGDVDFTNWSFSAPGYTGEATVEISIPLPGTDNVTLMFSDPALGLINFSLAYTAELTNGNAFTGVAQQLFAGNVPNGATVTGLYNGVSLGTQGTAFAAMSAQSDILPDASIVVHLSGTGAHPSHHGGPLQSVEMNLYQTPEPVTTALVGSGLLVLAFARRRRRS